MLSLTNAQPPLPFTRSRINSLLLPPKVLTKFRTFILFFSPLPLLVFRLGWLYDILNGQFSLCFVKLFINHSSLILNFYSTNSPTSRPTLLSKIMAGMSDIIILRYSHSCCLFFFLAGKWNIFSRNLLFPWLKVSWSEKSICFAAPGQTESYM